MIADILELCRHYSKVVNQLIISTHSLIMTTDMPKQAVILLKKDKGIIKCESLAKNTFAQQTYTLYESTFFMDKGAIGEFAKNKVNHTYHRLYDIEDKLCNGGSASDITEIESELADIRRTVALIDEPLVGGMLRQSIKLCEISLRRLKHENS